MNKSNTKKIFLQILIFLIDFGKIHSFLISLAIAVYPTIGYIFQIKLIRKELQVGNFNSFLCSILIFS